MNARKKVLLAGESWVTNATHYKGWDQFGSVTFHRGADDFLEALKRSPFDVHYMPSHEAAEQFPMTAAALEEYSVVILSDIGANTLLLHPDVWLHGKPVANRLKLIRDYVLAGGNLIMVGGYYSFQGINGGARYRATPIEEVLPVNMHPYDDRIEIPEGFAAQVTNPTHPILQGLTSPWPLLLGINEVTVKAGNNSDVLAKLPDDQGGHPLLVVGRFGEGKSMAWMSDMGPHWAPQTFVDWPGYSRLWTQALTWLSE